LTKGNGSHPPDSGDDAEHEEDFPIGDGTADSSADVVCPYCSERVTIGVDPGGGSLQQYVEDCEVCCNPWNVTVRFIGGTPHVSVEPIDQ
jgi:hypothetical protein